MSETISTLRRLSKLQTRRGSAGIEKRQVVVNEEVVDIETLVQLPHFGDDIGGLGVHIASRISALAGPGEILVSRTVRDLAAGSRLTFDDRGTHALKGVPEEWHLFAVG